MGLFVDLYRATDVRAITRKLAILDNVEMSSSVMPSAKYSSLLSGLILDKGSTAMRGPPSDELIRIFDTCTTVADLTGAEDYDSELKELREPGQGLSNGLVFSKIYFDKKNWSILCNKAPFGRQRSNEAYDQK